MQKIMFNDTYALTQAVLDGTKTMTRRIEKPTKINAGRSIDEVKYANYGLSIDGRGILLLLDKDDYAVGYVTPRYQLGEFVAIAQSYKTLYPNADFEMEDSYHFLTESKGWNNKLFVKADLLPHHIKITDVRIERLQEISDEDCMREGIKFVGELRADGYNDYYFSCRPTPKHPDNNMIGYFTSPCEAYAVLIDKINGKGTWGRNPFVFVYEFELVGKTKL